MSKRLLKVGRGASCICAMLLLFGLTGTAYASTSTPSAHSEAVSAVQQSKTVTGVVLDEFGAPLIGASVLVKGTQNGQVTDLDGRFTLPTEGKNKIILIVSYVGYTKQEVTAVVGKPMKISMVADSNLMEEVVVTGYGTFKKSAYAGSASNVKADKIAEIPSVSFQDLLQGNAPGVQFSQSSGQPGAATSINIRGMGSFNASNSPLYVIDGVPVRSGSINALSSDSGLDIMSTINSADIESITIIKDAAAASLYGSRAANGVVLITTKQGKQGKPQVTFRADWGKSDFAMDFRPMMGGAERRQYIYDGLYARAYQDCLDEVADGDENYTEAEMQAIAKEYADEEVEAYAPVPWCGFVDWDDYLFKKGNHQTYEASISGGTDRLKYYSSLSYLKQDGVTINSGLERISGRLNIDYQASKRLRTGANIMFATVNQDTYSEGTSYTSPLYASRRAVTPSDAPFNEDGTWNRDTYVNGKDYNALQSATYDYAREYVTRSFNTIYAEYEFLKNLKLKSTLSYDYTLTKGDDWSDPRTSNGEDENGYMTKKFYEYKKMVWSNQLSYNFSIANDHHFDVLGAYEIDDQYRDYLSGGASNFATYDRNNIGNGMKTEGVSGNSVRTRLVSYLARLNYDYKNRYYFGASFRTDGSSRLHRDNRWGSFWSVSGAWRAIEEDFMDPVKNWLTDLRLRVSYGVNGTLPSDYYGYMGLSSLTNGYLEQPGIIQSQLANKDLEWETNHNMNLGLDFGIFNRVNFTLEYYTRTTKNLLMDRPISMTTGFGTYLMNIGEVKNKGVELEINSTNFKTRDFQWNTTFNISHNKNEIVTLDGMQTEIISGSQIRKVGHSYRTFYMVEFAGINPDNGKPQFYTNELDENGNYIKDITENFSEANAIVLDKHAEPSVIGGLTNTFRYKWFDLNFMFSYQFGGYSYDTWAQKTEHGGDDLETVIPIYYRDSWKKPGDRTKYELFIEDAAGEPMEDVRTTRRLHSTDFIRLKTLAFGITLPKMWVNKVGVQNLRLYASANNLWTWAAWDHYDPEAVSAGTAYWETPPLKTFTFGLSLTL